MILRLPTLMFALTASSASAFLAPPSVRSAANKPLFVSIGLGPKETKEEDPEPVAGVDYEVPNHEEYRLSRRSKIDEQCDSWFGRLLDGDDGSLGKLAAEARATLTTPVELVNEIEKHHEDPEWTPYVNERLPWTPLVPAYGLEEYGLPIPRRNAEAWRHFDVPGLIQQDYSASPATVGDFSDEELAAITEKLQHQGGWLEDDDCEARLIYINGQFIPQLSKTSDIAFNVNSLDDVDEEAQKCLARLTDGFTDELAAPVPNNERIENSYSKLSLPDQNLGDATSQFAINTQQGTACFAALNTIKTDSVAFVRTPEGSNSELERAPPVLIVNAQTQSGGAASDATGVTVHPRTLAICGEKSRMSLVQSCVDLDLDNEQAKPKLYNGYTQVFVHKEGNMTHSYLEESGGIVTAGVEKSDDDFAEGEPTPREIEAARAPLQDSHLEAIDVHITGEDGAYEGTVMSVGGSGRVRIAHSLTLLQKGCHGTVNGFSLSGGTQRSDVKTNIHHIAQGTTSEQVQKNMIGGRATGAFRGRIRVEQSAQQTESNQLSRTVLLSDKARAWAVPSLEIIADDVQCEHGATVSDLSEEELFYLRSRGLKRSMARNLLMYAFAGDISTCVDPAMLGAIGESTGLQQRIIQRLENLVPQGERVVKGEFASI